MIEQLSIDHAERQMAGFTEREAEVINLVLRLMFEEKVMTQDES